MPIGIGHLCIQIILWRVWCLLQVQEVQQNKEKTLANNRTLAEQNLTLQPQLEHKKEQLTKSYSCLQESFESYQLCKSRLGMIAACTENTGNHSLLIGFIPGTWIFNATRFFRHLNTLTNEVIGNGYFNDALKQHGFSFYSHLSCPFSVMDWV